MKVSLVNRNTTEEGKWMVMSGECFLVEVQRDANTLLPLIAQYIHPGSIVYSDEWSSHNNQLSASTGLRYLTVNHSLHFVDPNKGAHTKE